MSAPASVASRSRSASIAARSLPTALAAASGPSTGAMGRAASSTSLPLRQQMLNGGVLGELRRLGVHRFAAAPRWPGMSTAGGGFSRTTSPPARASRVIPSTSASTSTSRTLAGSTGRVLPDLHGQMRPCTRSRAAAAASPPQPRCSARAAPHQTPAPLQPPLHNPARSPECQSAPPVSPHGTSRPRRRAAVHRSGACSFGCRVFIVAFFRIAWSVRAGSVRARAAR